MVKTCSVVWTSEDGISVTTLSLCCAATAPANRSRVEPTIVECMVKVVAGALGVNESLEIASLVSFV